MTSFDAQERTILHEIGAALAEHKLIIVIVQVCAVLGAYASLQLITEQYESSVRLLVKIGRENTEVPVTVDKGSVLSTGVRKEEINSEIQLLTSRDLIEATLDEIGVEAFKYRPAAPTTLLETIKYELKRLMREVKDQFQEALIRLNLRKRLTEREKVIVLLTRSLKVEREKDSDVIQAGLRLADPALAVRVLDVLVRNYLERHVEVRQDRNLSDFFAEQVQSYRRRLDQLGGAKQSVQDERRIASIADQRALALKRQRDLRDQIADLERERKLMAQQRVALGVDNSLPAGNARPAENGPAAATDARSQQLTSYPSLDLLKTRLTDLRLKRNEILKRYKPGSTVVQDVDDEIFELEMLSLRTVESTIREKRLEAAKLESVLDELSAGERELESVEQERQAAVQNFLVYSKRMEEARVSEQLDLRRISNIVVIGAAELPIQPVYPNKLLIMGASIPFGLMLGLGLALLLEYMNKTIRTARDLGEVAYLGPLGLPKGDLK